MEGSAALALRGKLTIGPALLLVLAVGPARAAGESHALTRAEWAAPATVEAAARHPALNGLLADFLARPGGWVRIAHGGGARGSAWAHEVQGWLVALGVPGERLRMDPGMAPKGELRLMAYDEGERP